MIDFPDFARKITLEIAENPATPPPPPDSRC